MSRIRDTRHNGIIKKGISGDVAVDSALWRLSLVLKEIAESTLEENEEKTPVDPAIRGKRPHSIDKLRKGGDR